MYLERYVRGLIIIVKQYSSLKRAVSIVITKAQVYVWQRHRGLYRRTYCYVKITGATLTKTTFVTGAILYSLLTLVFLLELLPLLQLHLLLVLFSLLGLLFLRHLLTLVFLLELLELLLLLKLFSFLGYRLHYLY